MVKTAGYLDAKYQNKIDYIFVPPKKIDQNKISGDAGHFIWTEVDSTDFKKENLASKIKKKKGKKTPYQKPEIDDILDQNAQIEVKKLSEKYPKKKFKLPGEITEKNFNTDINRLKAAKKIKQKYQKIRQNKLKSRNIIESNKVNKILKDIDTVEEIKIYLIKKEASCSTRHSKTIQNNKKA